MDEFKYVIPEESVDASTIDAPLLRKVESQMRDVFQKKGYEELFLPTFEYATLYETIRHENRESMFAFQNQEGKAISLRTDFTLPIARLYTNHDYDIKRYSYFGKVYRLQKRHKGRSSELYQGGIECIGVYGRIGDIECLSLIEETLPPIKNIKIELGHAHFYKRLLSFIKEGEMASILEKKSISSMKNFFKKYQYPKEIEDLFLHVLLSFGTIEDLKQLKTYCFDKELIESIEDLEALYQTSLNREHIIFDVLMTPKQDYYTGVMFKVYAPHSSYALLSGGRYDKLLSHFHKDVPAIGFSYHFNALIEAMKGDNYD